MSERSNILRILEEMRELGLADGGRIGFNDGGSTLTLMDGTIVQIPKGAFIDGKFKDIIYSSSKGDLLREEIIKGLSFANGGRIGLKEGLGSFETNDPKEAMKEVIKRFLEKNIETTTVPITENIFLNLDPGGS